MVTVLCLSSRPLELSSTYILFAIGRGVSISIFLLLFVSAFQSDLFTREILDDIDLEA